MVKEIENQVELILKNREVTYLATHLGQRKRDGWDCDAWLVSFTLRDGRAAYEEFDYFTGLGHRKPDDSAMAKMSTRSLRNVNKCMLAWHDHYKQFPDKVVRPHAASVLHSLLWDSGAAEQSFVSWCSELGFDTDSRKALTTYEACQVNSDKLCRVFDRDARAALREALQDY